MRGPSPPPAFCKPDIKAQYRVEARKATRKRNERRAELREERDKECEECEEVMRYPYPDEL